MKYFVKLSALTLLVAGITACQNPNQGQFTGSVVGAGVGALAGNAIGGGAGAVVGGVGGALVGGAAGRQAGYNNQRYQRYGQADTKPMQHHAVAQGESKHSVA